MTAIVRADDFRVDAHQETWRAIEALANDGRPIDFITVNDRLRSRDKHTIATPRYLDTLRKKAAVGGNIVEHAAIVANHAANRRFAEFVDNLQANSRATDRPGHDKFAEAEELLRKIGERTGKGSDQLRAMSFGELIDANPEMDPPVIDGLVRQGETLNVIAASKVGKSWLIMGLLVAAAAGKEWLGFPIRKGRCLLIDNELRPKTLAVRMKKVAGELGELKAARADIDELHLRGRMKDLYGIGQFLRSIKPGQYSVIVIDAWYRALPKDVDENSNGQIKDLYNLIDCWAERLGCCFIIIHHTSKGDQSQKSVTDVGAGAGSQSRATDTHLIIRPHTEPNVFVVEAAVRSFPPVPKKCIIWKWPLFTPTEELNPDDLLAPRKTSSRASAAETKAEEQQEAIRRRDVADDARLRNVLLAVDPEFKGFSYEKVKDRMKDEKGRGMGYPRFNAAIARLVDSRVLEECFIDVKSGNGTIKTGVAGLRIIPEERSSELFETSQRDVQTRRDDEPESGVRRPSGTSQRDV